MVMYPNCTIRFRHITNTKCTFFFLSALLKSASHKRMAMEIFSKDQMMQHEKRLNFSSYLSRIMRKLDFRLCENKGAVTAKLISAFVFATRIVQSLFFLNPKFQASSFLLRLHGPVHVRPGRKP